MKAVNTHCPTYATVTIHLAQRKMELRTRTVKVKVKFTLEQATKAERGSRGIALLFL